MQKFLLDLNHPDKIKKEQSYNAIFRTALGESAKEVIEKITQDYSLVDFLGQAKENPKILEKYLEKSDAEKIITRNGFRFTILGKQSAAFEQLVVYLIERG